MTNALQISTTVLPNLAGTSAPHSQSYVKVQSSRALMLSNLLSVLLCLPIVQLLLTRISNRCTNRYARTSIYFLMTSSMEPVCIHSRQQAVQIFARILLLRTKCARTVSSRQTSATCMMAASPAFQTSALRVQTHLIVVQATGLAVLLTHSGISALVSQNSVQLQRQMKL